MLFNTTSRYLLNNIENFINESTYSLRSFYQNISIINFGHLGDNNLHFNVCMDENLNKSHIKASKKMSIKLFFLQLRNLTVQ